MKTIRTELTGIEYFESKWNSYIKSKNCYGYLGHTHENKTYTNFKTIAAACDGYFEYIETSEGRALLIADMHLGLLESEEKFLTYILPALLKENYNLVIFLGDNYEMALCSDIEIRSCAFFNWLNNTRKPVYMLIGNHDINLEEKYNPVRVYTLISNNNVKFSRELIIGSLFFAHGDKFDPNTIKYGKAYQLAFSLIDYTGKYGRAIWNKVKGWFI